MTDINNLIRINVELEGLLKVVADRDSEHARDLIESKFAQYAGLMNDLFALWHNSVPQQKLETPVATTEPDPHVALVKDQEAEDAEVTDETDAAAAAITRGAAKQVRKVADRNSSLLKAFTLNDKFRFIRDIFSGDERDFNDTLALIADMDSYAEAEDYLVNDMMLDRENPAVADFFAVIERYLPA